MLIGDIDLHLFGEGTHQRLWQVLGAVHQPDGSTRFAVWAPNATGVDVIGDWNGWSPEQLRMQGSSGVWAICCDRAERGHHYKYMVHCADGRTVVKADPMAMAAERPPADASVVTRPSSHRWDDANWMESRSAAPGARMRVYEVHLGSWRHDLQTYCDVAVALGDHVSALGFTHVELLPVAEHPFGGSWGYQVSGYYAPTARFGTPDEFRYLVDELHQRGIGIILDWVPAHFPKDEWSLGRFDGTALYEHHDPRQGEHPEWGTYVFNYARNEVRNFLVANALYWFDEFHIDGLRVDAVASMLYLDYSREPEEWVPNRHGGRENLDAVSFFKQLNEQVRDLHPAVMMIAEESTSWPGVTAPVESGGLGFTHKWNMGWMHDTLAYFSNDPVYRSWHHHELTFGLLYAFSETFVLPLSHDEVVHGKRSLLGKMVGDDWQRFASLRALFGWMWALPGSPLLFMGAELAAWTEWNDSAGLPWHLLDHAPHRGVRDTLVELNEQADRWPATWEHDRDPTSFQWLDADDAPNSVYAFLRWAKAGDHAVVCLANFTPVPRGGYRVGLPWEGAWEIAFDSDSTQFGGAGSMGAALSLVATTEQSWQGQPASAQIDLPALGVVWLAANRPRAD